MVNETNDKKILTSFQYGDFQSDCSMSAIYAGFLPFMIGIVGIPAALKSLKKIVPTIPEVKILTSFVGAVTISVCTCKIVRDRCEAQLAEKYTIR